MKQKLSSLVLLFYFSCTLSLAQEWSKEDSIWLKNVLEGKEELIINEATKKAIEEGRLIMPSWMQNTDPSSSLELLMDFDNIGMPDDSLRIHNFDPLSMPPAVFALYLRYLVQMDSIYEIPSLTISDEERAYLTSLLPTGNIKTFSFSPSNISPSSGVIITTDFNHMLSMVFSARYRQTAKLRKNATAYKNYFDNGPSAGKSFHFTEQERKQLNNSINNRRTTFKFNYGKKLNGIDD